MALTGLSPDRGRVIAGISAHSGQQLIHTPLSQTVKMSPCLAVTEDLTVSVV